MALTFSWAGECFFFCVCVCFARYILTLSALAWDESFVPTENLRFREDALTFKVAQPGTTSEAAGGGEKVKRTATDPTGEKKKVGEEKPQLWFLIANSHFACINSGRATKRSGFQGQGGRRRCRIHEEARYDFL